MTREQRLAYYRAQAAERANTRGKAAALAAEVARLRARAQMGCDALGATEAARYAATQTAPARKVSKGRNWTSTRKQTTGRRKPTAVRLPNVPSWDAVSCVYRPRVPSDWRAMTLETR